MIKSFCVVLSIVAMMSLFTDCKKGAPALPPIKGDTSLRLDPGRYIIRTKYNCNDGGGFILRSASNHELITWERTDPENVDWQKDADEYIWNVQEVRARADFPTNGSSVRVGYSLFQEHTSGGFMILGMGRPQEVPEDKLGHGHGPSDNLTGYGWETKPEELVEGKNQTWLAEHPEYFSDPSFIFHIRSSTDSTYRMYNGGFKYGLVGRGWNDWIVSCTADPLGSHCDEYMPQPAMRYSTVGQGCTYIPDPNNPYYTPDVCYVTQLVFEKAN